ncbi:VanW family protein [Candidatus Poriferisocius sp.]|uniref:VanW family protein n=1 Tax=Candidatus Poriferisocius sp. TaxID=3101276 RepID=UPI003B02421D
MDPHSPLRLRRPPRPLWVWALMVAPVALLAIWLISWLVDSSSNDDKTPRGLKLESAAIPDVSIDIGGLSENDVAEVVAELAERFQQTPVEITTPSRVVTFNAQEIGLAVDVEGTVAAIMALDGDASNPIGWTASFFENSQSELLFEASTDASQLAKLEAELHQPPVDPSIVLENGIFQVTPGTPGEVADLSGALPQLLGAANRGASPLMAEADVRLIPPEVAESAMAVTADWMNQRTAQGLLVTVEEVTKRVQPAQLRSWVILYNVNNEWSYDIDRKKLEDDLAELFVEVATVASEPVLTVTDDTPVLVSEVPALICCDESAYREVLKALKTRLPAVELGLRESDKINDQSWLADRGIVELTGRFTTYYTAGQDRVSNIHRIAELIQGAVVYPGETFSVNEFVGERTEEKGFVDAGVIYDGVYSSDVGGGISQFITTLFTAAFNAGMEFPEYQAHSIDISRYREGVDATISWPKPDFKFRNPNPYAVLLWPTVNDDSITVSVYSTAYAEVEWTNRYDTPRRFCTLRTTERSRTYSDGTVLRDSAIALYQPREGINCDGVCTSSVLPLDGDGDGEAEFDDEGLHQECVSPEDCIGTHAPIDVDEDNRPDLCSIPPPAEEGEPGETGPKEGEPGDAAPEEPTPEATPPQDPETTPGQTQALDPERDQSA